MKAKWLLYLIPLAVGGFVFYRVMGKGKKSDVDKTPLTNAGAGVEPKTAVADDKFPLKKGSQGANVLKVQEALYRIGGVTNKDYLGKYGRDSKFGSLTEKGVYDNLKKTTIDSQADIDKLWQIYQLRLSGVKGDLSNYKPLKPLGAIDVTKPINQW